MLSIWDPRGKSAKTLTNVLLEDSEIKCEEAKLNEPPFISSKSRNSEVSLLFPQSPQNGSPPYFHRKSEENMN